jgi:hypothetical protein
MRETELVFFLDGRLEELLAKARESFKLLANQSLEIVEAFDFEDAELLSVLGKKGFKDSDEMYSEILRVVRLNPLNKLVVPKGFNKYMRPMLLAKL